MFFSDWDKKYKDSKISKTLLWEYDLSKFDWHDMRVVVVQRIIERGWMSDFYAGINLYGGLDNFREIIKDIPVLSDIDTAFVCNVFHLKKEELKCYTRKHSREIDCITYDFPCIKNIITDNNIRLYSKEDIAAMKLSTIADNGTRIKDFIDIAYLSTECTLSEMLKAYDLKFSNSNSLRALKGLNYYDDINFNEPVLMLGGIFQWDKIKERLLDMQTFPDKIFSRLQM